MTVLLKKQQQRRFYNVLNQISRNRGFYCPFSYLYAVNYSGVRHNTIVFNRRNLFIRDENICQYCGKRFSTDDLTVDHIIPRSKGGQSSWLNCVLACISCNRKKADYSLEKIGMSLIRSPFKPKWNPLYRTKVFVPSWERFLSEMYWSVELEP